MQFNHFLLAIFATIALIVAFVSAVPAEERVAKKTTSAAFRRLSKRETYSGTATWFSPENNGGNYGACWGEWIDDDSAIVALNANQYGSMNKNSDWCGTKVQISGPHGTATAKVLDACPGCGWGDLDLTPSLFKRVVGNLDKGVGKIHWKVI